ncbi:hypothetical protein L4D17_03620 [Vibrio splendidus]|uniref:hypothetical protein n=1 Tax=Vibrio splendidus TaxID=29497 RepID=UPI003D1185C1
MYNQGDLCPHCGLIIMLPTELEPKYLGCGEEINQQDDDSLTHWSAFCIFPKLYGIFLLFVMFDKEVSR